MTKGKAKERLEKVEKKKKNHLLALGIICVLALLIFGFFKLITLENEEEPNEYQANKVVGNDIIIEVNDISDGKFHYYYQAVQGIIVKYFVVTDKDGEVHTAFDACDVCYDAKKGYVQEGEYARCLNCGKTFSIYDLGTKNTAGGGCWPGYLPHVRQGDQVKIKVDDLRYGIHFFE
ncbi:MAG: Fe-S-containing protein [Thermoplasmatota archaeon]